MKLKKYLSKKILVFCLGWAMVGQTAFWVQNELAVQAIAKNYPLQQKPPYTVALDAGHGGYDTGANYGRLQEVLICEKTVDELFALLKQNPNFNPIRTRENGQGCPIGKRAEKATEEQASLLLSVHMNLDASNTQSHGFECFPLPPGRKWSQQSLQFAQCIAEEMGKEGHRLRGSNGVRFAYYSGKRKLIVDAEDSKERSLKSFGILEQVSCPAVLAEQCFLSNANDRKTWADEEGCKKAAQVYYRAICRYFSVDETPPIKDQKPSPIEPFFKQ